MQGKTVVITGATSGLGEAAALELARRGARVVLTARSVAKGEATLAKLRVINPVAHALHVGDFSVLAQVKRVAAAIASSEPRIDVLANNAGAVFATRGRTVDGLERTFAVNHLAPFVLTTMLLDRLKATPGARIVTTSSGAHPFGGALRLDDLQSTGKYRFMQVYGRSKLANIHMTRELARRLSGSGVTANCFAPGFVATNLGANNGWPSNLVVRLAGIMALTPEQGADTLVWLASSPEAASESGGYFYKRKPGKLAPFATDDQIAARLWTISEEIAARVPIPN